MDFDKNMLTFVIEVMLMKEKAPDSIAIMHGIDTEWPPGGE